MISGSFDRLDVAYMLGAASLTSVMPFQLSFDLRHKCKSLENGITIEAHLQSEDLLSLLTPG
jgi:hypothetical protein